VAAVAAVAASPSLSVGLSGAVRGAVWGTVWGSVCKWVSIWGSIWTMRTSESGEVATGPGETGVVGGDTRVGVVETGALQRGHVAASAPHSHLRMQGPGQGQGWVRG